MHVLELRLSDALDRSEERQRYAKAGTEAHDTLERAYAASDRHELLLRRLSWVFCAAAVLVLLGLFGVLPWWPASFAGLACSVVALWSAKRTRRIVLGLKGAWGHKQA